MATKKKAPAKKSPAKKEETRVEESHPVEEAVEQPQEEQNASKETKKEKSKPERVITILSKEDSAFLSRFTISRSAISRAVLRGAREFLSQFASKKDVTEQEIVDALQSKLK